MALFFTAQIPGDGRPMPDQLAAHPRFPLVAVGWSQGKVVVAGEDGERIASFGRTTSPSAITWHPHRRQLLVGWRDGQLSTWNEEDGEVVNPAPVHESLSVMMIELTASAGLALTSSKSCSVAVWQVDFNKLTNLWAVRTDVPMSMATHLSFPTTRGTDASLTATGRGSGAPAGAQDDDVVFAVSSPSSNVIFLLDDSQQPAPLVTLERDTMPKGVLWDETKRTLIVLTSNNTFTQFHVDFDIKVTPLSKSRISTGPNADFNLARLAWVGPGLVGTTSGEDVIRIFSLQNETMYALRLPEPPSQKANAALPPAQHISTIAAAAQKGVLAVATKEGLVAAWSYTNASLKDDADDWQLVTVFESESQIDKIALTSSGTVAALQPQAAIVLQETLRRRKWTGSASAVQISTDAITVESAAAKMQCVVRTKSAIKDLDLSFPQLLVWTGRQVELHSINDSTGTSTLMFAMDQTNPAIALHQDGILLGRENRVMMINFQQQPAKGNPISFTDTEGSPAIIDALGDFVVIITNKMFMKIVRVGASDLKPMGPSRPLFKDDPLGTKVIGARINSRGKKVILLTQLANGAKPDSRLHVYDVETDKISSHDFAATGEVPIAAFWNCPQQGAALQGDTEHLLLSCETKAVKQSQQPQQQNSGSPLTPASPSKGGAGGNESLLSTAGDDDAFISDGTQANVCTLFASPLGVVLHHTVPLQRDQLCLVGCTVPDLVFCTSKANSTNIADNRLSLKKLRDFQGMQADNDPKLREALMMFSYFTTIGNMDEAYRAVKTVKDVSVWQNLAKLSVTTRRLDVAEVCLANMQDGVAARMLRESKGEDQEVRVAMLAATLGMNEQAERLFRKAKRDDLLTEFLIANGKWDAAERHAETHDRIRVRPVHYRHAQHAESSGNLDMAMKLYEKASCLASEVTRMMFQSGQLEQLRHLATTTADKDLQVWWAQYLESQQDLAGALAFYEKAQDLYNVVRLLCCQNPPQLEKAIEIVSAPANAAQVGSGYFIGKTFEAQGETSKAIHFFNVAGAFKHAIHLAKANDLYGEVVALALKSDDRQVLLETGVFFEERSMFDKAVQMYQKAGDLQRAIDVCIRGGLFDELHRISESLDSAADPETFIQMAEHFINSGHFDKAAQMLVFAKAFNEALQLCIDKNVHLTEEMAEAMTPPKSDNDEDEEYRLSMLRKIAKVAKAQESWHLACKKYTQAGERVKAMKMLLRSGDTEKIMFFANHSRNAETYVLAGNYLQSQKWQSDPNIYKNIITFYTKAKAFESLAGFYDACSQLQIDEYRDYDKSLTTLREALKVLEKGENTQLKMKQLQDRIAVVESFVNARRMIKPGEPCNEMVQICSDLLNRSHRDHPDRDLVESSLRVGDVYALLVEYYDKLGQAENAYNLMARMRAEDIELSYFLEQTLVEKVCAATGHDIRSLMPPQGTAIGHAPAVGNGGGGRGFAENDVDDFVEEAVE